VTLVPVAKGKLSSSMPPFAALREAPGMARAYARASLSEWGLTDFSDVAELILGELVANAVNASEQARQTGVLVIRVCLIADADVLTIEVWDQAPGMPVLKNADPLAENGRGLAIVDDLTRGAWGCQPAIGQRGKCVWAELHLREKKASAMPIVAPCTPGADR
jgi:anti-sigma regulatory factor (Ser/Thr protein kinase)